MEAIRRKISDTISLNIGLFESYYFSQKPDYYHQFLSIFERRQKYIESLFDKILGICDSFQRPSLEEALTMVKSLHVSSEYSDDMDELYEEVIAKLEVAKSLM